MKATPMMAQWHACKKCAPKTLLFFRMGDFYEAFYDDAVAIARELDLTLTKRQDIPMAGVPYHAAEGYIDRLVAKGYRVAVAEQTEDPKKTKGLVKREVTRIVTPGTLINSSLIAEKTNNFFVSVSQIGRIMGLAVIDLSTGEYKTIEFDSESALANELFRLAPTECLVAEKIYSKHEALFVELQTRFNCLINREEDWRFDLRITHDYLLSHFRVHTLDGFGLKGMSSGINAAGALLHYLKETLSLPIAQITQLGTYSTNEYMVLDRTAQTNLELVETLARTGSRRETLLHVIDHTSTPMGGRLIRQWLLQPLLNPGKIRRRQEAVHTFLESGREQTAKLLDSVRDLERLMTKVASGYAGPRDLHVLKLSLQPLPELVSMLDAAAERAPLIAECQKHIKPQPELTQLIDCAISDEPPLRVSDLGVIKAGYHRELDELRSLSQNGRDWVANYQRSLREQLGIKTLKVGYNRMFGYYIEVSSGQTHLMPDSFQRRQTLVNAERYISDELKTYESRQLSAEERITAIESELFQQLLKQVAAFSDEVLRAAQAIAHIDCLLSLATTAAKQGYVCPVVDDSLLLEIAAGRHPVIESLNRDERFIPNDTLMDDDKNRLFLITGPNMAGKSTYLRQVALITILAQIGSFVPAESARIGVVDKIFTRIGASDDLARGRSTFMVEMTESAHILHSATERSLIILDEIGRGTSTYDGISIAWSIAEYLLTTPDKTAKTLFATHYFELTKLEEMIPGAVNYNVAVHESGDNIIFLRKIVRGGTDRSYGIHVARLAGLPNDVIARAKDILVHLEENANRKSVFEPSRPKRKLIRVKDESIDTQMTLFGST